MQIEQIVADKITLLRENLFVNAIHNRFDIKYGDNFDLYKINNELYVPVKQIDDSLFLGLYLIPIQYEVLESFIEYLFKKYEKAKTIELFHVNVNYFRDIEKKPHWHVDLPDTIEEFNSGLHTNTKYNMTRYPQKIINNLGQYEIKHYSKSEITDEIVKTYLKFKEKTHNTDYQLKDPLDYIEKFYVTDCYTLEINDKIYALLFLSNTDSNSFFENIGYDSELSKYSLGTVLYYAVIKDLIEKKYKKFFLLGGNYEYKKRFNGILLYTISTSVKRDLGSKYLLLAKIANFSSKQNKYLSKIIDFIIKSCCFKKKYKSFYKKITLK